MARRTSKATVSAGGWAILLLLGLIVVTVNAASAFVQANWVAIRTVLLAGVIVFVVSRVLKLFGRRPSFKTTDQESIKTLTIKEVRGSGGARRASARWIPPNEVVRVQSIVLSSGLFYLGEAAPGSSLEHRGQYVVNPNLPIATSRPDIEGTSMPYWPSYANITPNARRALLQWMADGRRDPAYGIGHVFLFFYGLEHRLFKEGARDDAAAVIAEVARLLSIYGENNSFRHYATQFLFAARVFAGFAIEAPCATADRDGSSEIADSIRLYIGKLLASTDILSADHALVWALAIPDVYPRTPAVRCFEEFQALWRARFVQKYPNGLRVRTSRKRLRLRYRAASGAFEVDLLREDETYPDIAGFGPPVGDLKALVEACTNELEAYSRFIGRHPNQKTSLQATLLLPDDLLVGVDANSITQLGGRLGELFQTRVSVSMQMRKLLHLANLEVPENGKLAPLTTDQLSQALDRIGFAIEPDRRYGGWAPQADDEIVLFRADRGGPIDPCQPVYRAIRTQVEVAVLAAAADATPSGEEFETIKNTIGAANGLSRIERARLLACALTLFKSPPKQKRVMRQLNERTPAERQAIARAAVAMIGADGRVDAAEVRFLEKLHKSLGLPKETVYSELHRSAVTVDEPVAVSTERRIPGIPIPKRKDQVIMIDQSRLARVRRDTEEVSKLLSQIFTDPSPQRDKHAIVGVVKMTSPLDGLDVAHAELVESVELRGEISRKEFEQRARSLKLLPEGALETINDWSFDRFDEPLLEDGDQIMIAAHLRDRLTELRGTLS